MDILVELKIYDAKQWRICPTHADHSRLSLDATLLNSPRLPSVDGGHHPICCSALSLAFVWPLSVSLAVLRSQSSHCVSVWVCIFLCVYGECSFLSLMALSVSISDTTPAKEKQRAIEPSRLHALPFLPSPFLPVWLCIISNRLIAVHSQPPLVTAHECASQPPPPFSLFPFVWLQHKHTTYTRSHTHTHTHAHT